MKGHLWGRMQHSSTYCYDLAVLDYSMTGRISRFREWPIEEEEGAHTSDGSWLYIDHIKRLIKFVILERLKIGNKVSQLGRQDSKLFSIFPFLGVYTTRVPAGIKVIISQPCDESLFGKKKRFFLFKKKKSDICREASGKRPPEITNNNWPVFWTIAYCILKLPRASKKQQRSPMQKKKKRRTLPPRRTCTAVRAPKRSQTNTARTDWPGSGSTFA